AAAGFLASHPGHVEIVWQGWQIDTSAAVLIAIFIAAVLLLWGLIALAGGLLSAPRRWRRRRAVRRRRAGEAAVTRGLVALAAGDAVRAQREAARAMQLLRGAPVPLLLAAEAAQQQGDRGMARQSFARLLERPETELLGLRGLLAEALKSGDHAIARRFAERARQLQPASPWLAENVLALQARAADWPAARDTIADAARRGALPAGRARHGRGVVLYELSREAEQKGDLRRAAAMAAPGITKPRRPGEPSRDLRGGVERAAVGGGAPSSRNGDRRRAAGRTKPAALPDDGAARRQRTWRPESGAPMARTRRGRTARPLLCLQPLQRGEHRLGTGLPGVRRLRRVHVAYPGASSDREPRLSRGGRGAAAASGAAVRRRRPGPAKCAERLG